jgi:hypothetical protein
MSKATTGEEEVLRLCRDLQTSCVGGSSKRANKPNKRVLTLFPPLSALV